MCGIRRPTTMSRRAYAWTCGPAAIRTPTPCSSRRPPTAFWCSPPEAAGSELTRRRLAEESGPEATLMWARVAVMRGSVNAAWDVAAFPARRAPAPHRCGCCPSSPSSRAVGPATAGRPRPGGAPVALHRARPVAEVAVRGGRSPVHAGARPGVSRARPGHGSARVRGMRRPHRHGAAPHASLGASSVIPRNGSRAPAASADRPCRGRSDPFRPDSIPHTERSGCAGTDVRASYRAARRSGSRRDRRRRDIARHRISTETHREVPGRRQFRHVLHRHQHPLLNFLLVRIRYGRGARLLSSSGGSASPAWCFSSVPQWGKWHPPVRRAGRRISPPGNRTS